MKIEVGSPVRCINGSLGELDDVIIDPFRQRVTHLVVEPHHKHRLARLVPVGLGFGRGPSMARDAVGLSSRAGLVRETIGGHALAAVPTISEDSGFCASSTRE